MRKGVLIPKQMKQLREYFGLSQVQMARKIHKTAAYVSNIEHGHCGISEESANTICALYKVSKAWLLQGEREMFVDPDIRAANREEIGSRIKLIREKQNLSRKEFSSLTSCSMKKLLKYEEDGAIPKDDVIRRIAEKRYARYEWLLTGEGEIENKIEESEEDLVDEHFIRWLRCHPEVVRELRKQAGLD